MRQNMPTLSSTLSKEFPKQGQVKWTTSALNENATESLFDVMDTLLLATAECEDTRSSDSAESWS